MAVRCVSRRRPPSWSCRTSGNLRRRSDSTRPVFTAAFGRDPLTEGDLALGVEHGKLRARQGIGVDDLLHAGRVAIDEAVETITQTGRAGDVPADVLLNLVNDLHRFSDRRMVAAAPAHREQERAP